MLVVGQKLQVVFRLLYWGSKEDAGCGVPAHPGLQKRVPIHTPGAGYGGLISKYQAICTLSVGLPVQGLNLTAEPRSLIF